MTISNSLENLWLDSLDGVGSTYSASGTYLQLHTGNPGEDCTASVASETDRIAVSFDPAASGSKSSDASVVWTNVAATEVYTHWSSGMPQQAEPHFGSVSFLQALRLPQVTLSRLPRSH